MNLKKLLLITLISLSVGVSAQNKIFAFSKIQTRNNVQTWGKVENIGKQLVQFTANQINLKVDRNYRLTISKITNLPDNGRIYLCSDEFQNNVTVTLINDVKMFLYTKEKRFQIIFDPIKKGIAVAKN